MFCDADPAGGQALDNDFNQKVPGRILKSKRNIAGYQTLNKQFDSKVET